MYRLAIAAIHLCGGPSSQGTEEAVIRLLNSSTEAVGNVQMMESAFGVENGQENLDCRFTEMWICH